MTEATKEDMPAWVPDAVQAYLAHVVDGQSIRSLARNAGCHASTILRQVRRCEQRRDDPLIDHALKRLGRELPPGSTPAPAKGNMTMSAIASERLPDTELLEAEGLRILRRLAEPGACLAVADGMETAVVVREGADGNTVRTGAVSRETAEAMALREWIVTRQGGRVARYHITQGGRVTLKTLLAREEARAQAARDDDRPERRTRNAPTESPLSMLARRRDKDGTLFLTPEMVRAGERLREEYELASMGGVPEGGWEVLLMGRAVSDTGQRGVTGALARLSAALSDLGPGLGDVVLRVCCQLEGLEVVEKRMGWAARSGKIVLRIGLQRLARHFELYGGPGGGLVG